MSIAELVIPYGDPSPGSYRKNAFDTGEIFVGFSTNSLELGCDCLGEIRYLDVAVADPDGTSGRSRTGSACTRRTPACCGSTPTPTATSRCAATGGSWSVVVTVDNYEYGYFWYFYQDGTIEFEAKLTGIVLTLAGDPGEPARYATEIAPGLLAPNHQHIFCARLDLDIDGVANTVVEVDAVAPPSGPTTPTAGVHDPADGARSEAVAKRVVDPVRSRYWKIINPERTGRWEQPVGYKLIPGQTYPRSLSRIEHRTGGPRSCTTTCG